MILGIPGIAVNALHRIPMARLARAIAWTPAETTGKQMPWFISPIVH
jgi:hypothetical protein